MIAPVMKPEPVSVTDAVDPAAPVAGAIAVNVGAAVAGVDGAEGLSLAHAVRRTAMVASAQVSRPRRTINRAYFVIQLRPCVLDDERCSTVEKELIGEETIGEAATMRSSFCVFADRL
jgi:hypothetical protein